MLMSPRHSQIQLLSAQIGSRVAWINLSNLPFLEQSILSRPDVTANKSLCDENMAKDW